MIHAETSIKSPCGGGNRRQGEQVISGTPSRSGKTGRAAHGSYSTRKGKVLQMYTAKEIKEMELQYNIKWMKPADDEEMAFQELERVGDFLNGLRLAFYSSGYNDSLVIEACRKAVNDINAACDKFISTIRQEDPEDQDSPDQQAND